ncbi:carbon-monoxide dehydrogenase large subunit [Tistlia consotensis]|uniref:Xanthine dehydrogenase, molybdenum binding subunit apoprotein n=1 Tax=Tistlia consotensis USBA 355 TaxID=560819 RepID=A0A1Y6CEI8_9PROT|nr:xanthine dehydrogenase family protein molybdopterin-binding subunit [Tistlia consotensis]SMF58656.1 xanthine dehydrogenase, molybdenum binding subunit apoprotein [Tistlia consotensis USBA 355]SNR63531.1 carbon-monoxide dehydrogenase large subunit [Tistlia consotensis]
MTEPVETLAARPKSVGARVRRTEDPRLLAGQGRYVDDLAPPRLLHVAFRRSDMSHARIRGLDLEAARGAPGVVAVVAAADLEGLAKPLVAASRMASYHGTPLRPLAEGKVRFVGEPVVAVAAESRYLAEDALELVDIDFEPLGTVIDPEAAAAGDAPLLHEEIGTNVLVERRFRRGEPEAAFAAAAHRVGGSFRFRRKSPGAIENRACLAEWDAGRGALTLHSASGIPGIVRDALSEALDLPGHRLRVVAPDVGGSFGGKGSLYPEEILVSLLARRLGRPIKWTSDRLEDLTATSQAFDEIVEAEMALDAEGRVLALRAEVLGDTGAYSIYPWTAGLEPVQVVGFLPGPYRIEHYEAHVRAVATSKAPTGPYRGVGRPAAVFATERLMDLAARKLGLDPKEIRLRNFVRPEDFPYKIGSGIVWDRSGFTECLEAACARAGYPALREKQRQARAEGRWFGIGLASYAELTGIGSKISVAPGMPINTGTETAVVRIDSTGGITAAVGIASHGQGLETTLAQVVADELGARLEDIRIVQGDSDAVPNATGTYASRGAVLAGGAAILASRVVREKLLRAAGHLLEAAEADLEARDGRVTVAGTDRSMSFREIARAVYSEIGRIPHDKREELEATRLYDPYYGTTSSATHVATLEIDPETYRVTLGAYLVAEDCGRIINPMIVDGQVHGGVAQGVGAALYEEVVYDADGQNLTASLVDYLIPSAPEVPPMTVLHVEGELPATLGGFRGMGEGGTIGAPAAIANALSDALAPLGIGIDELPATPERLFRLIERAQQRQDNQSTGEER